MKRPPLKHGDVYPAHVLRDEYGMNAENRPVISVDASDVPDDLRRLIPLVERWAIPCDVTRGDYFDKQSDSDIAEFWHSVNPYVARIDAWLDEQPEDVGRWPDAAIHFMYFLKAHGEAWQPTEEEAREIEQQRKAAAHRRALNDAVEQGLLAFKSHDYAAVVAALEPFTEELDKVAAAKLAYARRTLG